MFFRCILWVGLPLAIVLLLKFYDLRETGRDLLDWVAETTDRAVAVFNAGEHSGEPDVGEGRIFYKWQDEDNHWHYGDTPPAGSRSLTRVSVLPSQNVLPARQTQVKTDPNATDEVDTP